MNNRLVTAIITTHNRKDLLKRAINSVFSQTYKKMELIVVDDHSDDGTCEICHDSRIKYIFIPKEESRGGNYARNLGIKSAKGDYCAFLDDDDCWLPSKIEKQVALIEERNCELVYCGRRFEFVKETHVSYKDILPSSRECGDMHQKILSTIPCTTSCILAKRNALLEIGLFDDNLRFWQEYELTIRLAQRNQIFFVNLPLVIYRVDVKDRNRLTNKYFEWLETVNYIQKKHSQLYDCLNIWNRFKVKNLIWHDSAMRCKASGLRRLSLYFNILYFPYRLFSKIERRLLK